jgi:hypothetical protein
MPQIPNVYPEGHPPFVPGRLVIYDDVALNAVIRAAREVGVVPHLIHAYGDFYGMRHLLEASRVHLFRAEYFMEA